MATNTSNVIKMRSSTSSPSFAYSGAYVGCLFTDNTTNNYHQDPRLALAAGNLQVQPMLNTKMLISPSPSPRLPQGSAASSWANNTIEYCAPLLGEDVQSMEAAGLPAPSLLRCSSQFLLVDEEDEEDELLHALGSFVSGDPSGPSSMFSSVASRASDHSLYCLSVIDDASGLTREATPEEAWKVNELLIKERHEVHMERAEAAAKAATAHGRRRPPTVPSAIPRQQQLPLPKSSSHHEEGGDSIPTSQHFHQAPPASASFTMPAGTFLPPPSSFIDKSVMMMSIQEEEGGGGDAAARDSASGLLHRRGGPCNHCGATESPQWRRGPPKTPTLCNACGMRFRRTNQLNLPPPPPPPMPSDAAAKAAQRMKNNSSYSPITLCQDEVLPETYSIAEAPLQEQGVVLMASATSVGPRVTKRVPKADAPLHLAELTCGDAAQESPAAYKRVKRAAAVGVAQLTAALAAS